MMTASELHSTGLQAERIVMREVNLPLRRPFVTANGSEVSRRLIIIEIHNNGVVGYGESPPLSAPFYTEETPETVWYILREFLIPIARRKVWSHPSELADALRPIRRHSMAKAGLEAAYWDLYARQIGKPLASIVGGTRKRVAAGVAIGIETDMTKLLAEVASFLAQGYQRIKVKIRPGWDFEPMAGIRQEYPDLPLFADANSAYTLADIDHLQRLDSLDLAMIEQPLAHDDIVDHATLQRHLKTPICLDESILSAEDARKALELGSCRIINIKAPRVGGLTEALRIHALCEEWGVPVWCGGMIDSGIGKAHNLALASLPGFTLPGDLPESARHWEEDLITPAIELDDAGYIAVPQATGIGIDVDQRAVERHTVRVETF